MNNNKNLTNNRFEYIFSESSLGIFFYDYNGNITSINKKIKNNFKFFDKGNNIYDFISNENFIDELKNSIKNGRGYFEGSLELKDKKYVKVYFRSIKDNNEFITGFAILENITNRKKFENRLFLERKYFKKILFSIDNAIISIDTNGVINMLNHVANEITNISSYYAYGRKIDKILKLKKNEKSINLYELIKNKEIKFNEQYNYKLINPELVREINKNTIKYLNYNLYWYFINSPNW